VCVNTEVDFNSPDMKVTAKGRRLRLQQTIDELKAKKTMSRDDLVRFVMNKWVLSRRITEIYIDELTDIGKIKLVEKPEGEFVECVEGE
jgi:hypothetical protein